jgi:branched-chain amino acid transport system substrate-binding protein
MIGKIIGWVLVLVLVVWGIFALTRDGEPTEEGPIKIGLSAPLTGEAASFGEATLGGVELAVKEINDAGGVNGRMIELIAEDDLCSSEGINAINKLINVDKVHAIIGPVCSAAGGPAVPVAQESGTPTIIWASAPALTSAGDYIFRSYPSDALQGKAAAEFVYNTLGKRKAAVLYVNNDWGVGLDGVFNSVFEGLGGEVTSRETVNQDATDTRTQITKIKDSEPDVLYIPLYPKTGVISLKQIKELGLDVPLVGGDAFSTEEIILLAEADGMAFIRGKSPENEEFNATVKEVTGREPNFFSAFGYDSIKILASVIEEVGTSPVDLRDALAKVSYSGGMSVPLVEFSQNGDLKDAEFEVRLIKGGVDVDYFEDQAMMEKDN